MNLQEMQELLFRQQQQQINDLKRQMAQLSSRSAQAIVAYSVPVVSSLPTGSRGMLVSLSSDNKLYHHNGSTWVAQT